MEHSLKALQRPKADIATEQSVQIHNMCVYTYFIQHILQCVAKADKCMEQCKCWSNLHNKYPTLCVHKTSSQVQTQRLLTGNT